MTKEQFKQMFEEWEEYCEQIEYSPTSEEIAAYWWNKVIYELDKWGEIDLNTYRDFKISS